MKALDHHQQQLDLAIAELEAASAEVAEAKDKKKMLEKEHGRLMAHKRVGCMYISFCCVLYLVFDMCADY